MMLIEAIQNHTGIFYAGVAILGMLAGFLLNVIIRRVPAMMLNEWYAAAHEMEVKQPALSCTSTSTAITATDAYSSFEPCSPCVQGNNKKAWWTYFLAMGSHLLRGDRHQRTPATSARATTITLVTIILSLAVAAQFGTSMQCVVALITTWLLMAMSMIDLDHHLLPDNLTLPLMWIGLLASLFTVFTDVRSSIVGAAAGYLILWVVFQLFRLCTGKEAIGYGDLKLLAAFGALLGWQQLPVIIFFSFLIAAIAGIALIALTDRDIRKSLPFGPYLAAAGWLAMLWGENILTSYLACMHRNSTCLWIFSGEV